ncbi:ATP-binding protein [Arthrobacter sp. efr-133-R2A-63]|uniref:ATP-binding protein n=1 Tax=Arthrobacter sp. efr-133-R2A-63 TaxID=3040278 RepID=UPI00254F59E0|nr:ATP-binding protein [Arthrobacter sp. efr-133-R2A-63]
MTETITMVPDPHLMESMRAVGYTLETAIADLIDNSITAGASRVDLLFSGEGEGYVAVIDDGAGMTPSEAQNAMRLAGKNSLSGRAANDLGRFGLGLKTASISQCRDLTVVSKKDGKLHGYRWDLDYLIESGTWSLLQLAEDECQTLPEFAELDKKPTGTLVIWRKLDQLEAMAGDLDRGFDESMVRVRKHLGLVFHRYLAGEHGRKFDIAINYRAIEGADPLLQSHRATQAGPLEKIHVEGEVIELRPFTLPHLNKLSSADRQRAQVDGSLRDSQGFYIYREKRLVIWGTWFRIAPKQELGKLARVRVDIPNTLDHLWALDIKKAQAVPPPAIRNRLRQIADNIVGPSRRVHEYRGRRAASGPVSHLWDVVDDRTSFRYEINRNHPAIVVLEASMASDESRMLGALITMLEQSFPVEDVYNRLGQDAVHSPHSADDVELNMLAVSLWESLSGALGPERFVDSMLNSEPFNAHPRARGILENVVNS